MKCPYCNKDVFIQVATQIQCKTCRILTNFTSVLTVQCENCSKIFQIPLQSNSLISVKRDNKD